MQVVVTAQPLKRAEEETAQRLSEAFVLLFDKSTSSRAAATRLLRTLVGRLAVVTDADDMARALQAYPQRKGQRGIDCIVMDLDAKTARLMDTLRSRIGEPLVSPALSKELRFMCPV
jgi:CheY-like chemotaxis protein